MRGTVAAVVLAAVVACMGIGMASPPGVGSYAHARKLIVKRRAAAGAYVRTPWVYCFGASQVEFAPDCGNASGDSSTVFQFADDTTLTVRDSVAAGDSLAVLDRVCNVVVIGPAGNVTLERNRGKRWTILPLTVAAAAPGEARGGGGVLGVRWVRASWRFKAAGVSSYLGCDSLTVRSTTVRPVPSAEVPY